MEITKLKYTKKGSKGETYTCRIWTISQTKEIVFIDCECWNFNNRRLKKEGKVFMIKYSATPCKHLSKQVDALFKQGYKFKENKTNEGEDKCSNKLRLAILKTCNNTCSTEGCNETENLNTHRILAGAYGGKYSLINCIALCPEHHKQRHAGEFK